MKPRERGILAGTIFLLGIVIIAALISFFSITKAQRETDEMISGWFSCKACTKCYAYEENTRYGWYSTSNGTKWSCGCYNMETDEWTGICNVTEDGRVVYLEAYDVRSKR